MDELINKLKEISSLLELQDINHINTNNLLYAICKSGRYDFLKDFNIRLNLSDSSTLESLIELLLSDEDIVYYMNRNGFDFTKEELNIIFNIVLQKYQYSYQFEMFLRTFFVNNDELNSFIKEHENFFKKYLNEVGYVPYSIKKCDSIVELILNENNASLVQEVENYSLSNLKLLVKFIKRGNNIPYYIGNDRYAYHLFEVKNGLEPFEFMDLLGILKEKTVYDRKSGDSDITLFNALVKENIDYLIESVSHTKTFPKCLIESSLFRDECIKRNRIDLAGKCILSPDIIKNGSLVNAYCTELNIDSKSFLERGKWLLDYHKKNNNIFNTILTTSLRDNIFNFKKEHLERFINDVDVQISLSRLSDKELILLSRILNIYGYKDYDISSMVVNIINNIGYYPELINSIDIKYISQEDLKKLVSVLQLPNNQYQINSMESLHNYDMLRRLSFENSLFSNDLTLSKDNLLKLLFNITLSDAQFIDSKYCHDNNDNNILNNLKNSEIQPLVYNYLELINKIVESNNIEDLTAIYNSLEGNKIYNYELPLEPYLRAKYTELYSQSLYRIEEKNQVYGPKDNILNVVNYNQKSIKVCIPRANFNFFVHCVGSCSLTSEVTDSNYRNDWLDRPQLQDHFVACSYINEKGIYSIRSEGSIIYGFDTLESGSILGMGNTDIDSIGRYANAYDGSKELQEGNGSRARYFVPSEILKTINNGYNEIVVERRNMDKSRSSEFKRKPDYIIMMVDFIDQYTCSCLEDLYQNVLSFISDEDKKEVELINNSKKMKEFLRKYKEIISQYANNQGMQTNDMANHLVNVIMNAKYYEDCLKASSQFDIPLVIVDKTYYFNKILFESGMYDEESLEGIAEFYSNADGYTKKKLFNIVATGGDVAKIMQPKESNRFIVIS